MDTKRIEELKSGIAAMIEAMPTAEEAERGRQAEIYLRKQTEQNRAGWEKRTHEAEQELSDIDTALGNVSAFGGCKTRAEKVAKAMTEAKKADGYRVDIGSLQRDITALKADRDYTLKHTAGVQSALDAAGAPHYDPMEEGSSQPVRTWTLAERIAWLLNKLKEVERLYAYKDQTATTFMEQVKKLQTPAGALDILRGAMLQDLDYAWSWHCNIAMACHDAGARPQEACNEGAARFLGLLFPGVDTRKYPAFPKPAKRIPLEASDVPPGSVFRHIGWNPGIWIAPVLCAQRDVVWCRNPMSGSPTVERLSWAELKEEWQILRPGKEWEVCSKEAPAEEPGLSSDFDAQFPSGLPRVADVLAQAGKPFPHGMGTSEPTKRQELIAAGWKETITGWCSAYPSSTTNYANYSLMDAYSLLIELKQRPNP